MLNADQVRAFMTGRTLCAFDPADGSQVARVTYGADGRAHVLHPDGATDEGDWGLVGNTYWTRYDKMRDGTRNSFHLEQVTQDVVQAWFADGRRAMIQTPLEELPPGLTDE